MPCHSISNIHVRTTQAMTPILSYRNKGKRQKHKGHVGHAVPLPPLSLLPSPLPSHSPCQFPPNSLLCRWSPGIHHHQVQGHWAFLVQVHRTALLRHLSELLFLTFSQLLNCSMGLISMNTGRPTTSDCSSKSIMTSRTSTFPRAAAMADTSRCEAGARHP